MLGGIFHFYSNFERKFCKQTVETLIRHHVRLRRLIWVCTICLCPRKRTLCIYGLNAIVLLISRELQKFGRYIPSESALGTSHLSKFIKMKILNIKLRNERQCHKTKQLVHSFSVYVRISQLSKVMFTVLGLTNPDVNLKRMHQLYIVASIILLMFFSIVF